MGVTIGTLLFRNESIIIGGEAIGVCYMEETNAPTKS
jgi:hypothetical protein